MGATGVAPILITYALALCDGLNRTVVGAGAAVDAGVCIDHVMLIAGSDGLNRTVAGAQTAGNAIFTDDVCHMCTPPCILDRSPYPFIVACIFEKAILFCGIFSAVDGNVLKQRNFGYDKFAWR